ncbi:MAG: SLC13 family permease [Clostridiales bacterium]|nr:SLC13 family permease [Clostridiales bacterium]MDY4182498.1 SLC13 family permease [Pseudoflavonifractor sp.]
MPDKKSIANKKSYPPIRYFHIAVTLFLMFGFGFLPTFATVTPVGMKVLGVFLGVIYGYSTCEVIWPSMFAFIAFGTCGYAASFNAAIASMMGSGTVFQIITQYFAAGAIIIYGFGKWFVRWSLSRKMFQGKPLFYTWCFMFVFMWSAIVVSQIPMGLLLYAIWADIADSCGYEKNSTFRYYGFGGILLSLMMGGAMIPYKSWMLGLANTWKEVTGGSVNLGVMFLLTAIAGTIIITLYVFLGARLFNVDFSIMKAFDVEKLGEESKHLRPRARRIVVIFLATMLLTIYAGTFTKAPGADFLNNTLTTGGLFCLCAAILFVLPSGEGDGKPCIVFNDIKHTDEAVSWPVILMCAVTIPVASALTNEATGVLPWLTSLVSPIFEGRSPVFIIVFTVIVMMFLTNIGSNIAFGGAMIPVISPFVIASGMNPVIAGATLIWCANMGLVLPGASAPASIFHGRSEIPSAGQRYKIVAFSAALVMVVSIVVFSIAQLIVGI